MDKIRLIVNADDFGFTRGVNEGIVEAHRNGILTATTLMANGDAFEHAVGLARDTPTLDVGCHLVLVQGHSVLDPSRVFPEKIGDLIRLMARREIDVEAELRAQIRRIVDAGVNPSHLDSHKHTHLLPPVLTAVSRLAREFDIPWVRRPFDFGIDSKAALTKRIVAFGMRVTKPAFVNALSGLRTTDFFTGFQVTGSLGPERLIETLERLPEGLTEFMCHPGYLNDELRAASTRLKESRATELTALTSPEARAVIEGRGIVLTRYRDQ